MILRICFFLVLVFVTYQTLAPASDIKTTFSIGEWISNRLFGHTEFGDKVGHFLAYGALGYLFVLGWKPPLRTLLLGVAGLTVYGGVLEVFQGLSVSRQMDPYDAIANFFGALLGAAVASVFVRMFFVERKFV